LEADISILLEPGHFYFALTRVRPGRRCLDFLESPADLRGLGELHDGPVARGARLASVSREQVRQDGVQALMFLAIEFGILDERYIPRSSNLPHLADHTHSFVLQGLEFVAHIFCGGGRGFYDHDDAEQRYFRTPLWISC
jgi:hypothetical protein